MLDRSKSMHKRIRKLLLERLEARLPLAQASLVEHLFREDDFSINGTFTYRLHEPEEFDYIDTIDNGTYTSSEGHVRWTSPKDGRGHFEGTAIGDGRDTVNFLGRRTCSEYGIEDIGRFDFVIDATLDSMRIDRTENISTRYTYYNDRTGGRCEQPDPPWSRFFGGRSNLYIGTFSAEDHRASVRYDGDNPDLTVDSPKSEVKWTNTQATDFELTAEAYYDEPEVPDGWIDVPQTSEPPDDLTVVDVVNGGIEVTVNVHGKPLRTNNVLETIGRIRVYWARSATDTTGPEIPVTSTGEPLGVYWNSSQVSAVIDEFPQPPAGMTHLRITIDAPSAADAIPSNSSTFLRLSTFEARNDSSGPLSEDGVLNGLLASVLHLADSTDPTVKVFAYKSPTALGASVSIEDDEGSYLYDPTMAPLIQALAPGETINDAIEFLAIKDQTFVDGAVRVVTLEGRNDDPVAESDDVATTNYQSLRITPNALLLNDSDIDHGDTVAFKSIESTSMLGANVRTVWNESLTAVREIVYEPASSDFIRTLEKGQEILDQVIYEIIDKHGALGFGQLLITVTGEEPRIFIGSIPQQLTIMNSTTNPIWLSLHDPDGDATDLALSATASDPVLIPAGNLRFSEDMGSPSLEVTPAAGMTGRTTITVTASGPGGKSASTQFSLLVGTEADADLDGAPNSEEDAGPSGGDMNLDGILDSQQANVASRRAHSGNAYFSVAAPAGAFLENVFGSENAAASGLAANATFPLGLIHYELLVDTPGASSVVTFRSDFAELPLNRYFQYDSSLSGEARWQFLMHNKADGAQVFHERIEVSVRDGGRADLRPADNSRIVATVGLAHVSTPWKNIVPEDIDNDGFIVPLDVLAIVNEINFVGARPLGQRPDTWDWIPYFIDPSGSNSLEPIDALVIINYLNRRAAQAEGEMQSLDASVVQSWNSRTQPALTSSLFAAADERRVRQPERIALEQPRRSNPIARYEESVTSNRRREVRHIVYGDLLDELLADDFR